MGWRFRKSIKILPGVRVNIGKNSTSISVGGRGYHRTYSSTGRVTTSIGIPGTGLYYTTSTNENSTVMRQARSTQSREDANYNSTNYVDNVSAPIAVNVNAIRNDVTAIYRDSIQVIDWRRILISSSGEYHEYYKSRAEKILNGDIDTYYEVLSDLNPFDRLIQYGSDFECGTDDPRMLAVHFNVNSYQVLREALSLPVEQYNDLLQDYVCGCAIRIARDIFALLPLRSVLINAIDNGEDILSVKFKKRSFETLNFSRIDASDTVEQFEYRMNFNLHDGFKPIIPIE